MIVLVTYDIKKADKDYTEFYTALKKQGRWWHYCRRLGFYIPQSSL